MKVGCSWPELPSTSTVTLNVPPLTPQAACLVPPGTRQVLGSRGRSCCPPARYSASSLTGDKLPTPCPPHYLPPLDDNPRTACTTHWKRARLQQSPTLYISTRVPPISSSRPAHYFTRPRSLLCIMGVRTAWGLVLTFTTCSLGTTEAQEGQHPLAGFNPDACPNYRDYSQHSQ